MSLLLFYTFLLLLRLSSITAQRDSSYKLSKPLAGDDSKVYTCLGKNLFAFQSNGTIAWTFHLNYSCHTGIAPIQGGIRKLYLVAENRVLKINTLKIGTDESAVEIFFGPEPGEILGISVSTSTSCVVINVRNKGLFAYRLHGQLLWRGGPVIYQSGYRQGCRKNVTGCYFRSVPVIDQCEASIYISNNEGELYALSVHSYYFKWIVDLSSFDKDFTVTAGNNGRLYVTIPSKALILGLDVSRGTVLWQKGIGPLSSMDIEPVVDSNGWISVGSLDGYMYSFSPTGIMKKFPKRASVDNTVIQVSPVLDCSGYAVYISRAEMEGKISRTIGDYNYVTVKKAINAVFSVVVPARGSLFWSESYTGVFFSLLSHSDLQHFAIDERMLLAFVAASNTGNPLPCRSTRQKLASSCSQAMSNRVNVDTGNERAVMMFLLFESVVLIVLAGIVLFCCMFWRKKKVQSQNLGKFLEKRRSLQIQNKEYNRTITELEKTGSDKVLDEMTKLVKERDDIEMKLSTSYSLGRDRTNTTNSTSLLPLYDETKTKTQSYTSSSSSSSDDSITDKDENDACESDYMASVSSLNSGSKTKDSFSSCSQSMRKRAFSSTISESEI